MSEAERSEKITVNLGLIDLGQIDLLVSEGFFTNRTDFIRTAIRRQLESRSTAVDSTVAIVTDNAAVSVNGPVVLTGAASNAIETQGGTINFASSES